MSNLLFLLNVICLTVVNTQIYPTTPVLGNDNTKSTASKSSATIQPPWSRLENLQQLLLALQSQGSLLQLQSTAVDHGKAISTLQKIVQTLQMTTAEIKKITTVYQSKAEAIFTQVLLKLTNQTSLLGGLSSEISSLKNNTRDMENNIKRDEKELYRQGKEIKQLQLIVQQLVGRTQKMEAKLPIIDQAVQSVTANMSAVQMQIGSYSDYIKGMYSSYTNLLYCLFLLFTLSVSGLFFNFISHLHVCKGHFVSPV